jgi:hypothetical protein
VVCGRAGAAIPAAVEAAAGGSLASGAERGLQVGYGPFRPGGVTSRPGLTFGMVGMNGSAAFADIDSGVAVAMRNRLAPGDLRLAARTDRIVAEAPS